MGLAFPLRGTWVFAFGILMIVVSVFPPNMNSVSGRENRLKPVAGACSERVLTRFLYQTMNSFIGFGKRYKFRQNFVVLVFFVDHPPRIANALSCS